MNATDAILLTISFLMLCYLGIALFKAEGF